MSKIIIPILILILITGCTTIACHKECFNAKKDYEKINILYGKCRKISEFHEDYHEQLINYRGESYCSPGRFCDCRLKDGTFLSDARLQYEKENTEKTSFVPVTCNEVPGYDSDKYDSFNICFVNDWSDYCSDECSKLGLEFNTVEEHNGNISCRCVPIFDFLE